MVIHGYSENELKKLSDNSVDLIITSPPYANRRKNTYGGIPVDEYIDWFKPIAIEIKRVLKPTGSFFLNIKPHTKNGERVLYVFDLVLMLKRELGFLFVDEYCWTKNAYPGRYVGRFKNGFEPVYHFIKGEIKNITFNPLACGTPPKESSKGRSRVCGKMRPENGSGMSINRENLKRVKLARPSNVINVNNVSNQYTLKKKHSATFPDGLVEFFIKSFSNKNDVVLDLFAGSGTVGVVCKKYNRNYILIDKEKDNIELIHQRLDKTIEIKPTKPLF